MSVRVRAYARVCVCIFHIVNLMPTVCVSFADNIVNLNVHYVCLMLVQRSEPQGRRFTNFHDYY